MNGAKKTLQTIRRLAALLRQAWDRRTGPDSNYYRGMGTLGDMPWALLDEAAPPPAAAAQEDARNVIASPWRPADRPSGAHR